ncbi:hypothetical protein F2Q69_00062712 [Brassica cretica]|uniref:Uncharacterized protein n=1 Tax=Brassica cretica TaxID=69181 RepID=A0A8S9RJ50_BRACR|nr:hypothetical protein F2Q69_00062712 [Brassica cretica]
MISVSGNLDPVCDLIAVKIVPLCAVLHRLSSVTAEFRRVSSSIAGGRWLVLSLTRVLGALLHVVG